MTYDPLSSRIHDSVAAERDRLKARVEELEDQNRRLRSGARDILRFAHTCLDEVKRLRTDEKLAISA